MFTITNAQHGVVVDSVSYSAGVCTAPEVVPTTAVSDLTLAAGTYNLVVTHSGDQPADSAYTLVSVAHTPATVNPGTYSGQAVARPADGVCYFRAKLRGGSKYMFGLDDNNAECKIWSVDDTWYERVPDGTFPSGFAIYPEVDDTFIFKVTSTAQSVTLRHRMAGTRAVAQHPVAGTLAIGGSAEAEPGFVNAPGSGYQDGIIDGCLYRVQLTAGKKYLFSTEGAQTNLLMRVYNSQGAVVAESGTDGVADSFNVRALVEPTMAGVYYVGLAQAGLDEIEYTDEPAGGKVTLSVVEASQSDDATALDVKPNTWTGLVQDGFTSSRWTRTYTIAARKGVTYRLKTSTAADTALSLAMRAYKLAGTRETAPAAAVWSGKPDDDGVYELKANENAEYRIELSVDGAKGCDYPEFTLSHEAVGTSGALGVLKVDTKGADGQWHLDNETMTKYANGASVLVAGTVKVTFSMVTGFSTPAAQTVEVKAWQTEGDETEVTGVYSDTFDPRDDSPAGATMLTVSAREGSVSRTLFADDPQDYFSFTATAGNYYDFVLDASEGSDAGLVIVDASGETLWEGKGGCSRLELGSGRLFAVVTHFGETPADGSYTLTYKSANVGAIKFQSTAVSAKEDAEYVELTVSRTAREGAVRAKFTTMAGTAKPGSEYYPTNGILEWAANDMTAKKIRINLIPELTPEWTGADKTFTVELSPIEESKLEDGEYPAAIATQSATVALADTTGKTPGTIAVTGYDNGDGDEKLLAVATKASVSVKAGETLVLNLKRLSGHDGTVGVKVSMTASSGTLATVSTNEVVWADGDDAVKSVEFAIDEFANTGNWDAAGSITVNLAAVTGAGYERVFLATTSVAVAVDSEIVGDTLDNYLKYGSYASGLKATSSKAGLWVFDDMEALRTKPLAANEDVSLSFSLTGPGFFKASPSMSEGDGGAYVDAVEGNTSLGNVDGVDVAMIVAKSSTVRFNFHAGAYAGTASYPDIHGELSSYDGAPCVWVPFSQIAPDAPKNGAVVEESRLTSLAWSIPSVLEDNNDGFYYHLTMDESPAMLGSTNALVSAITAGTSVDLDVSKLKAGVTYYWRLDYGFNDAYLTDAIDWTAGEEVWSFTMAGGIDVPHTEIVDGHDANGNEAVATSVITLMQGVGASVTVGATNVSGTVKYTVRSGSLPPGLSIDADTGVISGVPSKTGDYEVLVQSAIGEIAGDTTAVAFEVLPLGTAVGTFTAFLREDGSSLTNDLQAIGAISLQTTASGSMTANVKLGGKAYSFKSNGFDAVSDVEAEGDEEFDYRVITATLYQSDSAGVTNTLAVSLIDASTNSVVAAGAMSGAVSLKMASLNEAEFVGNLWRDNTSRSDVLAALEPFAGYYTVSMLPGGEDDDAPKGNGYLTATIDKAGQAKLAGSLSDGTSVSASAKVALEGTVSSAADNYDRVAVVPFFVNAAKYSFGGELRIRLAVDSAGNATPVTDSSAVIIWNSIDAAATRDGVRGWHEMLAPVGGWYDTIKNLQRYYLNDEFLVDAGSKLPQELLPSGSTAFAADCLPNGRGILFASGNKFAAYASPWNFTVSFTRATGIVNGTFAAITADGKTLSGLKHAGVLILNREAKTPMDDDVITSGYFLSPVRTGTRTWNCSLPFSIRAVNRGDVDWYAEDGAEPPLE